MQSFNAAQIAFLVLVFVAAFGFVLGVAWMFRRGKVQDRLSRLMGSPTLPEPEQARSGWIESVVRLATPLAKLSVPDAGWEDSALRRRFMQAGLRGEEVPTLYFALKTILAVALPGIAWMAISISGTRTDMDTLLPIIVMLLCIGFYAPNAGLARMISQRQLEIFEAFPDAIDLLTICVEAGLSLDAAIARVAGEIRLKSEALADELQLVTLEMRAGAAKERALRNLALRTGVDDIDTLVAMLIQSEKFGTSIGDSLRVHSEMLRTKRLQRAEETAAKVAVKLVVPLVVFIFPSILVVVAGPAIISIAKTLPMIFGSG